MMIKLLQATEDYTYDKNEWVKLVILYTYTSASVKMFTCWYIGWMVVDRMTEMLGKEMPFASAYLKLVR